jgi:type 2 lantibiotic biosynthesis protein LanM
MNGEAALELARWRERYPFKEGDLFERRLASDGLTESDLQYILTAPVETLSSQRPDFPGWLETLYLAFTAFPAGSPARPTPANGENDDQILLGFLNVVDPLLYQARQRLQASLRHLAAEREVALFDPEQIELMFWENLPGRLLMLLNRTLVLELHVARLRGQLTGETPAERFSSFLERLHQPNVLLALWQEYPVLTRQLSIQIDQWVDVNLEFLEHLLADWEDICRTFNLEAETGPITALQGGMGDRHRNGRSVFMVTFASGFKLVYKPRSLQGDIHFQTLLAWLNKRGDHPPFRTLTVLERGSHGWMEFVTAHGCTSEAEVGRFYERQGGFLALLYLLEATDFHGENVIASGEHPVLVDLESLFHPRMTLAEQSQSTWLANRTINKSVLRSGMLPQRLWSKQDAAGIDISALGAKPGQLTPYLVPRWEDVGTDSMRFTRRQIPLPGANNRPSLNNDEIDVLDFADAILTGFTTIYQLLLDYRDELLADGGPLACFAQDEVRVIIRSTQIYGRLLLESFHPDMLRDALERDRLFDQLWGSVQQVPALEKAIPAELASLRRGDVPLFTAHPDSCDIWAGPDERIPDFFAQSGLSLVYERMRHLSADDLARQRWFIQASLTTLAMGDAQGYKPIIHPMTPPTAPNGEQLIHAAQAVGDRLDVLALRGDDDASWLGVTLVNEDQWALAPLGTDFYDGLPGVILFLAHLGQITGAERHTHLAHLALTTLTRQLASARPTLKSIGGFNGWGGLIYTFTQLGLLWDRTDLLEQAESFVSNLHPLIEQDQTLDVIGGAAGCIGGLLVLNQARPSETTVAAAIQCGEWLLKQAQPMAQGVGWPPPARVGNTPLTGFSHGAAGMAWALLSLAAQTDDSRFRDTALAALAYERSLFSPTAGNWPDLRDRKRDDEQTTSQKFMTAWCHGAPGIGLSRLRLMPYLDDPLLRQEIDQAIQATRRAGFGGNHSLCHGDLGNLELLLTADQILPDISLQPDINYLSGLILAGIEQHGWLSGVPLGVETPGLMTGLAGIGYGLLRLAVPTRLPSLLTMEPLIAVNDLAGSQTSEFSEK